MKGGQEMADEPAELEDATEESGSAPQIREGTLAWLQQLPHVNVLGLSLPNVHRIPDGSTLAPLDDDDFHCRLIRPDGRRCGAVGTRVYGICNAHLGGGARDLTAIGAAGRASRARMKVRRQMLGIGPARVGNPRSHARIAALERAEELAEALVNAPLDDPSLGTIERQRAALAALDATFPLQQATLELELPADPDEVASMGWEQMQQLAAKLLTSG